MHVRKWLNTVAFCVAVAALVLVIAGCSDGRKLDIRGDIDGCQLSCGAVQPAPPGEMPLAVDTPWYQFW